MEINARKWVDWLFLAIIRLVSNRTENGGSFDADPKSAESQARRTFSFETLQEADIDGFRAMMVDVIRSREPHQAALRTKEKFYQEAFTNSHEWTLLAVKDEARKIVGGLEALIVSHEGEQIGYVQMFTKWVLTLQITILHLSDFILKLA